MTVNKKKIQMNEINFYKSAIKLDMGKAIVKFSRKIVNYFLYRQRKLYSEFFI